MILSLALQSYQKGDLHRSVSDDEKETLVSTISTIGVRIECVRDKRR